MNMSDWLFDRLQDICVKHKEYLIKLIEETEVDPKLLIELNQSRSQWNGDFLGNILARSVRSYCMNDPDKTWEERYDTFNKIYSFTYQQLKNEQLKELGKMIDDEYIKEKQESKK